MESSPTYVLIPFLLTHPVWDVTWFDIEDKVQARLFLLTHPVWDVTIVRRFN